MPVKINLFNNLFFRVIELETYRMLREYSEFKTKSIEADQNFQAIVPVLHTILLQKGKNAKIFMEKKK